MSDYMDCPKCGLRVHRTLTVEHHHSQLAKGFTYHPAKCTYCGQFAGAGATRTRKQQQTEQYKDHQNTYDEQVYLYYVYPDGETKNAPDVEYELKNKKTGEVLASGKTDDGGNTERFQTNQPEDVTITALVGNEYMNIGQCRTNNREYSRHSARIPKGHIFFDIYYIVADRSFALAAETRRRLHTQSGRYDERRGDIWLTYPVSTEGGFKTAWKTVYDKQKELDMFVKEGHIYSHASLSKLGLIGKAGLDFKTSENEDGTLTFGEIAELEILNWAMSSELHLYGCRTGRVDAKAAMSAVDAFFDRQSSVKWVWGQRGFTSFSYSQHRFIEIDEDPKDLRDIFLVAFWNKRLNRGYEKPLPQSMNDPAEVMPPYSRNR